MADAELRRRHPGIELDPLRSAEPGPPAPISAIPTAADVEARREHTRQALARVTGRLQERQGLQIPAAEPDSGYEGQAWPDPWAHWRRDAILQPAPPQMPAADRVAERYADREAGQ
jgi:hypothetical protein